MTDDLTDGHLLNALDQIRNLKSERATLRDQFAMAALTGITRGTPVSAAQSAATCAYLFADAMLEARKEKK
jgi:hypothetical protein